MTPARHALHGIARAEAVDLARQALDAARTTRPTPSLKAVWGALHDVVLPGYCGTDGAPVEVVHGLIALTQAQCPEHGAGCAAQIPVALATLLGVAGPPGWPCCCAHTWTQLVHPTVPGRVLQ